MIRDRHPNCCPTCGRPIPPDEGLRLTRIQQRIMDLLERHGEIHSEVLWTALYASDPNGGPEPTIIDVHINQMNKRLRPHGLMIQRRNRQKKHEPWRLVRALKEAAE